MPVRAGQFHCQRRETKPVSWLLLIENEYCFGCRERQTVTCSSRHKVEPWISLSLIRLKRERQVAVEPVKRLPLLHSA